MSTVFFADMRASHSINLFDKISTLLSRCELPKKTLPHDLTAVKIHFGERGNSAFIRPIFARRVVDDIRNCGAKPFLTDSTTLYPGERKEAVSALSCGIEHGFAYAVVQAPLIISDGLRGVTETRVALKTPLLSEAFIGTEIVEADALVALSHFKCHELTGFGGEIKNLGMGCASRKGKLVQHSTVAPQVKAAHCTGCELCLASCAHGAITMHGNSAVIDEHRCTGCSRCITVCPSKAIAIQWNEASDLVMRKMAEYALAAIQNKRDKTVFVNFITQVSPACDCYGHCDAPIVNDIGICASTDPVALDQACCDLVNAATGNPHSALTSGHEPGGDKFKGVWPAIPWQVQLEHAEQIGLGSRSYLLEKI